MKLRKILVSFPVLFALMAENVMAHCPLCTIGAAAAAGGASLLGVKNIVIGIFIGAFAASIGLWVSRVIKKKYVPFQDALIVLFSFVATVVPMMPIITGFYPLYISLAGEYGSLLNRTYLISLFLVGSVMGAFIMSITPWLSSRITKIRDGKMVPYQGIALTLLLLVVVGVILQFATA